jgi:hypothetical protein
MIVYCEKTDGYFKIPRSFGLESFFAGAALIDGLGPTVFRKEASD